MVEFCIQKIKNSLSIDIRYCILSFFCIYQDSEGHSLPRKTLTSRTAAIIFVTKITALYC